jgi:hypothetical protein
MSLLTSDRPRYYYRLDVLVSNLRIHPCGPVSSWAPFTHLYTDFLCLLADPLDFEGPPPGTPIAAGWTSSQPRPVYCAVVPYSFPIPPPPTAHIHVPPLLMFSATTMDSLDCSQASALCVILGSPSAIPRLLSPSQSFLSQTPRASCVWCLGPGQ